MANVPRTNSMGTRKKFHPSTHNTYILWFMNFGQLFTTIYTLLLRARDLARHDLIINISFCIMSSQCFKFLKTIFSKN